MREVIRFLDNEFDKIPLSHKVETVLFHIWARSVVAAPSNHFRKRWFFKLLLFPFFPFIHLYLHILSKQFRSISTFLRKLVTLPLELFFIIFEIVTDGALSKSIARANISKGEKIDVKSISPIIIDLIAIPGSALMQEPFLSEANNITTIQMQSTHQNQERLMKAVSEYWTKHHSVYH